MLCAVIKTPSFEAIEKANEQADLMEFRLDEMGALSYSMVHSLRKACRKPVIFKGGLGVMNWLTCAPDFVDLPFHTPLEVFEEVEKAYPSIQRICSWHDFEKTPQHFDLIFERPAEIYKLATLANSTLDALRMLHFVKHAPKPVVGICMGEAGVITRILAPVVGSPFTYAAIDDDQKTAPGQLLLSELRNRYQYDSLHPETALYGLLGDPISNSPSHYTHNFTFRQLDVDAIYLKLRLSKEEIDTFFPLAIGLGFKGFSVTMPLKEAILPYLDVLHDCCGSINTIVVNENKLHGWNTDGKGAIAALEKKERLEKKHLVLLGAGGTARAIAHEALKKGARVTILNRTLERAQKAALDMGCKAGLLSSFSEVAKEGYDCLINCTPLGMGDDDKQTPVESSYLLENKLVMDVVSNPDLTPFLKAARRKKCRIVKGMDLFVQQAVEQFCLWFSHAENH